MKIINQILIAMALVGTCTCSNKNSKVAESKQINNSVRYENNIVAIDSAESKTNSEDNNKSAELIIVDSASIFEGVKKGNSSL